MGEPVDSAKPQMIFGRKMQVEVSFEKNKLIVEYTGD